MSVDVGDIVAVGGDFKPATLISAYRRGIFPWPIDGLPLLPWFCPKRRAVVDFDELHIPRSLARMRRRLPFRFTIDAAFARVIQHCATVPRGDDGRGCEGRGREDRDRLQGDGRGREDGGREDDRRQGEGRGR